jgi:hypothetical protein
MPFGETWHSETPGWLRWASSEDQPVCGMARRPTTTAAPRSLALLRVRFQRLLQAFAGHQAFAWFNYCCHHKRGGAWSGGGALLTHLDSLTG